MDYTKVISTVKKYAFAIDDAIDTLSRNIETALEALFTNTKKETDAIKTDVASVKSDVAGVKTDTGINLPQKIDAGTQEIKNATEQIKTSVAEISSHIASEETLPYPRTVVSVKCELGGKRTCVNIKGRGYLNYALMNISGNSSKGTVYIKIDGRAFILMSDTTDCAVGLLDENEVVGYGTYNTLNGFVVLKDFYIKRPVTNQTVSLSGSLNRVDFINGKDYRYINNPIFCNGKIPFNTSLEVLGESTGQYAQTCRVSYELY